ESQDSVGVRAVVQSLASMFVLGEEPQQTPPGPKAGTVSIRVAVLFFCLLTFVICEDAGKSQPQQSSTGPTQGQAVSIWT
ncbi:unnamed protein product, partial [Symbiodinium pilosum]